MTSPRSVAAFLYSRTRVPSPDHLLPPPIGWTLAKPSLTQHPQPLDHQLTPKTSYPFPPSMCAPPTFLTPCSHDHDFMMNSYCSLTTYHAILTTQAHTLCPMT